jgi:hypothetical protein
MPRHARLDAPGALHHIMLRGINKEDLFLDDLDRTKDKGDIFNDDRREASASLCKPAKCAAYSTPYLRPSVSVRAVTT